MVIIDLLQKAGCKIRAYDPVAMDECRRRMSLKEDGQPDLVYCKDMYDAVFEADALLLLTEWKEFRLPSWDVIGKAMNRKLVIDGRNIFDKDDVVEHGFEYHCIGK